MHVNVMSNQIFILTVTLIVLNHAKLIARSKKDTYQEELFS